jgi:hypothetical protein
MHANVSLVTFAAILGLSSHFLVKGVAIFRPLLSSLTFISGFFERFLPQCASVIQGNFNDKVYQGSFMVTSRHLSQALVHRLSPLCTFLVAA